MLLQGQLKRFEKNIEYYYLSFFAFKIGTLFVVFKRLWCWLCWKSKGEFSDKKIVEKLRDKKIAILGFGKEGKSTYSFIRKYLGDKHLTIIDINDVSNNEMFVNDNNVDFVCGEGEWEQ